MAARQYDAWDLGMVSSDDFTNADVRYEQSFSNIRASLSRTNGGPQEVPIVTGFLARGENTGMHLMHYSMLMGGFVLGTALSVLCNPLLKLFVNLCNTASVKQHKYTGLGSQV